MHTVNATGPGPNTNQNLDEVASLDECVMVDRSHTAKAQMRPPEQTITAAQALASLSYPMLTPAQASAWLADSKAQPATTRTISRHLLE